MTSLKDDNYLVIQGWMRTRLRLTGTKLLVYAAIYGFSQDGVNEYTGSQEWLAEFVGVTPRGAQKALRTLIADGLIVKIERNGKLGSTNGYKAIRPMDEEGGTNIVRTGGEHSSYPPRTEFVPIKINNNINNNIQESKKEKDKQELQERARTCAKDLSAMTDEELQASYDALCASVPETPEGVASVFDECCAYLEELARRFERSQTTSKERKPSKAKGGKRPSWDEILAGYQFNPYVVRRMLEFIRHCFAGGQFMSNERLTLLCDKLLDVAELHEDEGEQAVGFRQVTVIDRAISGGYYDFLVT